MIIRKAVMPAVLVSTALGIVFFCLRHPDGREEGGLSQQVPAAAQELHHEAIASLTIENASPIEHELATDSAGRLNQYGKLEVATREPGRVPALPGEEGLYLPLDSTGGLFAAALAAESRDVTWAPEMERRINEALQDQEDLRGLQVRIVCRDTSCGLLFVYSEAGDPARLKEQIKEFRALAASELGFAGSGTMSMQLGDGTRYTQVRLSEANGRGQDLPPSSFPPLLPERFRDRVPTASGSAAIGAPVVLSGHQADHSPSASTLEFVVRREATSLLGGTANSLQVECRTSACIVVLGFLHGASPDPTKIGAQIASAAGLTYASAQKQSDADSDILTLVLNR